MGDVINTLPHQWSTWPVNRGWQSTGVSPGPWKNRLKKATMKKQIITSGLSLLAGVGLTLAIVSYAGAAQPLPDGALLPCATEDSLNCYWDASEQGNGEGNDFVSPATELEDSAR